MEDYEVTVEPLQQTLKIYNKSKGQSSKGKTRYLVSMLITSLGLKECRVHLVQGELSHEINLIVFQEVKKLGFDKAQFEVPTGTPASRFAKYIKTVDGLDRYEVDLV